MKAVQVDPAGRVTFVMVLCEICGAELYTLRLVPSQVAEWVEWVGYPQVEYCDRCEHDQPH